MNGSSLHQFRYDQKAFWRNPASVFFTVMFPVVLLLIFATVFGGQTVKVRGGIKTDHLLRAGDHHALGDLGDDAEPGDVAGDRARGRPPQARPRHADAALGLHRGADRQLDRRRADHAGPAGGDRRHPLRRCRFPGNGRPAILVTLVIGAAVLLLPRHRPDRGDPLPGRRGADRQRAASAALLPLRRLHPGGPAPQRGHPLRRRLPDPPLLRGLL